MRRLAVIYNPASGRGVAQRLVRVSEAVRVFEQAGLEVEAIATYSPRSASDQARDAVQRGCDTVVVCGGDGTIHEALQGLVGQPAALGVIPMGTANALAADLGIPYQPARAARMLMSAKPRQLSAGRVSYLDMDGAPCSRYFIVAAGIGVDAHFFSRLHSGLKKRFGYPGYVLDALRLWARHTFPAFIAEFKGSTEGPIYTDEVSQVLAVRVSNFGGVVRHLVPGAELACNRLHVIAFKTRDRYRYLRFMVSVVLRRHTYSGPIQHLECDTVECRDPSGVLQPTLVEADGELLGMVPAKIEVIPQALTLLVPER